MDKDENYGLSTEKPNRQIKPPKIEYLPPKPKTYRPKIGLIGAGGISSYHLKAYKELGLEVVAIASRTLEKAVQRRDEYFPDAVVFEDYREMLKREEIEVLDITPHPVDRIPIIREALLSKKHVLSQKPFVLEVNEGRDLIRLARENKV